MKTKVIKLEVLQFENGDVLLGTNLDETHFVKTEEGEVEQYSKSEMEEIYDYNPTLSE